MSNVIGTHDLSGWVQKQKQYYMPQTWQKVLTDPHTMDSAPLDNSVTTHVRQRIEKLIFLLSESNILPGIVEYHFPDDPKKIAQRLQDLDWMYKRVQPAQFSSDLFDEKRHSTIEHRIEMENNEGFLQNAVLLRLPNAREYIEKPSTLVASDKRDTSEWLQHLLNITDLSAKQIREIPNDQKITILDNVEIIKATVETGIEKYKRIFAEEPSGTKKAILELGEIQVSMNSKKYFELAKRWEGTPYENFCIALGTARASATRWLTEIPFLLTQEQGAAVINHKIALAFEQ